MKYFYRTKCLDCHYGWKAYLDLGSKGYRHVRIIVSKSDGEAHEHLPASHLVFMLLKRTLLGTYHGGVGVRHTPAYLDEVVFASTGVA